MTLWSTIFPEKATLLGRKWWKAAGSFNHAVPVGPKWCMAHVLGCGGFGDQPGGGGAFVRTRFPVTAGENLVLQVGSPSTQTIAGDSFVKRNDGTVLAYADRGRGNRNAGAIELSVGEIRRAGTMGAYDGDGATIGGLPGGDAADPRQLFGALAGLVEQTPSMTPRHPAQWGGGGRVWYFQDEDGNNARPGWPGGSGVICLEFYDKRPKL